MERNKSIDIARACSIILIILYHVMAIMGNGNHIVNLLMIRDFLSYGGEIGVTLFFVLSGLGITYSIHYREASGHPYRWTEFMKKRIDRIVPQYYFCVLTLVVLTDCAVFLSNEGIFQVVSHLGFFHNLTAISSGSINGALWTMGTIMRFYLFALPLYKAVRKKPILTLAVSVIFTMLSKMAVYAVVDIYMGGEHGCYFCYGRELVTSLDNFVVGMTVGHFLLSQKEKTVEKTAGNRKRILFMLLDIAAIDVLICISKGRNIWANTKTAWVWHSCLALVLGYLLWNVANLKFDFKGKLSSVLLWVAKYEYGIYLWHIVIIYNLYGKSPWMQQISQKSYILSAAVILLISCAAGYISTEGIENGLIKKLQKKKGM